MRREINYIKNSTRFRKASWKTPVMMKLLTVKFIFWRKIEIENNREKEGEELAQIKVAHDLLWGSPSIFQSFSREICGNNSQMQMRFDEKN